MAGAPVEVPISQDVLLTALAAAGDAILVGGQALAVWAEIFGVPLDPARGAYTRDVDFLGDRNTVIQLARATHGRAVFPGPHELTILAGEVRLQETADSYMALDVVRQLNGLQAAVVAQHALSVHLPAVATLRVMHPLDVLASRVKNLQTIETKQNDEGLAQVLLAIQITHAYLTQLCHHPSPNIRVTAEIEHVARIARSNAGRTVAKSWGIRFLEAIPGDAVVDPGFQATRWPQIVLELQ